jgi:hypothetical protein
MGGAVDGALTVETAVMGPPEEVELGAWAGIGLGATTGEETLGGGA